MYCTKRQHKPDVYRHKRHKATLPYFLILHRTFVLSTYIFPFYIGTYNACNQMFCAVRHSISALVFCKLLLWLYYGAVLLYIRSWRQSEPMIDTKYKYISNSCYHRWFRNLLFAAQSRDSTIFAGYRFRHGHLPLLGNWVASLSTVRHK